MMRTVTPSYFWLVLALVLSLSTSISAQHPGGEHVLTHEASGSSQWEGSPDGIAYSEFNHKLLAAFVFLIGLSELRSAFDRSSLAPTQFVLPLAMLVAGGYLLGWSDHEAWPIGSLSFSQTFFGGDWELLLHKLSALFLLGVGMIEGVRWYANRKTPAWALPLPIFAIVGGLFLFLHQHGNHPGSHDIMLHHAVMGSTAIAAGSSRLATSGVIGSTTRQKHWAWRVAWPALILLIALQLWLYRDGPSG
jgi:putative copper resistance protein D